ncbi:hypothetical protein ACH4VR_29575 [Streptomyces sp. NPDC020883]|uniref:hypothetical protein n=1 Tax=Streptomyces sp. NPDC020883 TaxID=3365099 RepID=UPI0037ACCED2
MALKGRATGPLVPAPEFPQLSLSAYEFEPAVLAEFAERFDGALASPDGSLIMTVHASVPDYDFDHGYAWVYDPHTKEFDSVPRINAEPLFHEDTHVLRYRLDKPPFLSVSALWPTPPATA